MATSEEEATISYPSIAIVLVFGFLLYRYFSASSATATSSPHSRNGLRFTQAQVDQVAGMFPQMSRMDIMWDLQRNRGSVNATVERVLAGRGLDPAPPSFRPNLPPHPSPSSPSQSTTLSSLLSSAKKAEPDLITRYKLQDRISTSDKGKERAASSSSSSGSWAATKNERQDLLKRRRDEMILEARRKMMEKDQGGDGS